MLASNAPVLVTGATGFLGGALARRLVADGVRVRALVRSPQKAESLGALGVELVTGDLLDPAAITQAVAGCAVVFHSAAALDGTYDKQRPVNVTGTELLTRAAAAAGVQRFVHVSTLAVYSPVYTGVIDETKAAIPGQDPYGSTKAEGERVVQVISAETGLRHTIIRPGGIYGPRAGLWTRTLHQLATGRVTPFIGDGHARAPYIHVSDVVEMLILAAQHEAAVNETFNCANDPAPTWREIFNAYARLAGKTPNWLGIPKPIAAVLAGTVMLSAPRGSVLRDLPDYLRFVTRPDKQFSMAKARTCLGWQPRVDLETGVASCAEWLREKGLLA